MEKCRTDQNQMESASTSFFSSTVKIFGNQRLYQSKDKQYFEFIQSQKTVLLLEQPFLHCHKSLQKFMNIVNEKYLGTQ